MPGKGVPSRRVCAGECRVVPFRLEAWPGKVSKPTRRDHTWMDGFPPTARHGKGGQKVYRIPPARRQMDRPNVVSGRNRLPALSPGRCGGGASVHGVGAISFRGGRTEPARFGTTWRDDARERTARSGVEPGIQLTGYLAGPRIPLYAVGRRAIVLDDVATSPFVRPVQLQAHRADLPALGSRS